MRHVGTYSARIADMTDFTLQETSWSRHAEELGRVRRTVFIEEQGVPATLEWDEDDAGALHLLAQAVNGEPIGCARLLPDGHLGRMAVLADWRGRGVGQALLTAALKAARARGHTQVQLSAQTHAVAFYVRAGFVSIGPEYDEAGMPHVSMQKFLF